MLLFLIFGLPSFLEPPHIPEPTSSTDRVVEISLVSNVPNEEKSEKVKPNKPIEDTRKTVKATPATSKAVTPPKPPAVPLPTPVKPVKPVKPDPNKDKQKPEKKDDPMKEIFKDIENKARTTESNKPTEVKASDHTSKSDKPFIGNQLTLSELDFIKHQFEACWDEPTGSKDPQSLAVPVYVELNPDGSVIKVEFRGDSGRYNRDTFYRAAADSAVRAVHRCNPIKNLPAGKYSTWRETIFNFTPSS